MIRKLRNNKFRLESKTKDSKGHHKNLGTYSSREGAKKRERQVEYFKSRRG